MTSPLRGLSIAVKLPLLIGALLVVGVILGVAVTYDSVRQSAIAGTRQRLGLVADQLSGMLSASGNQLRVSTSTVADTPAVRAYVRNPGPATRGPALELLRTALVASKQLAAVEVRNGEGDTLFTVGDAARWSDPRVDSSLTHDALARNIEVIGPLRRRQDTVVYAIAAPVRLAGDPTGVLVYWLKVNSSRDAREQLNALIGAGGRLYIGTPKDSVWTDLVQPVRPPPVEVEGHREMLEYDRPDSGATVAMARRVAGMPWTVLIEFSRAQAYAGTARFLKRQLLISAILLAVLLTGTWLASRTITAPLTALTTATEVVAGGNLEQPIHDGRRTDELGRLAEAFDVMVAHVRGSHEVLESRVAERTRELQERNEELEAFGYSLAHDLRAPLRAMQGFSQALLEDYGSRLDATGRHYAQLVADSAQAMDRMILDLLAYSRIARTEVTPAPVDLDRVLRHAATQVKAAVDERRGRVTIEPGLPPILGHEPTLVQAFANLIGNAVKFVPADRIPEARVRAHAWNGRVRVWVEDNGIGIDPQYHERIFRVFERLNNGDDYPGTGIGLAIVRKAVEKMGGKVGVESTPGTGSRFWVELERAPEVPLDARD
jgi:signal transduction histidine kinase